MYMCGCIVCTCAHMYICVHVRERVHVCEWVSVYCVNVCVHTPVCMCCVCVCTGKCVLCEDVCTHLYVCACTGEKVHVCECVRERGGRKGGRSGQIKQIWQVLTFGESE